MRKSAYLQRLRADLDRWVSVEWIDAELANKMHADAGAQSKEGGASPVLPGLATLIITLGLLTIIAANWSDLTGIMRIGLFLLLFTLVTLGSGEFKARNLNLPSNLLAAIAAALTGGGLVIIGQIYHTGATTSGFLSVWTMMALAVSLILWSSRALFLTALLCILWTGFHFADNDFWGRGSEQFYYAPLWALPVWFAVGAFAAAARQLSLVHLTFVGMAMAISPTIYDLFPLVSERYTTAALLAAAIWGGVGFGFESIARSSGAWATRTLAGWSAWLASAQLVVAAVADRFVTKNFGEFGLPLIALILFTALTAYGAAPGRRWLRGAGIAGFIAVSVIFFTVAKNLIASGVIMILFGLALIALLMVTNRMLKRREAMQTALGASS